MEREELEVKLVSLGAERLATALTELAMIDDHAMQVVDLLVCEQEPLKLAKKLSSRVAALRRARRFIGCRESFRFARELEVTLDGLERLIAVDPKRSFRLLDRFITSDSNTFDRIDDSSGSVGGVYQEASRLLLKAAARARVEDTKKSDWPALLQERSEADDYGLREDLLAKASQLLSEPELRQLAAQFEEQAGPVPASAHSHTAGDYGRHRALTRLSLIAQALEDPPSEW